MNIQEGIIIIYFLVALNFLFNKLKDYSCHVQRIYNKSLFIKHGLNIVSTFFLLVIFTRSMPIHPLLIVLSTFLIYLFFIAISRCDYKFLGIFIILMTIVFYLESAKTYDISKKQDDPVHKEHIQKVYSTYQIQIQILSFLVIFIGLIVYIGQHAIEYQYDWDWGKFWMGVSACSGNQSYENDIITDFINGVDRIVK